MRVGDFPCAYPFFVSHVHGVRVSSCGVTMAAQLGLIDYMLIYKFSVSISLYICIVYCILYMCVCYRNKSMFGCMLDFCNNVHYIFKLV